MGLIFNGNNGTDTISATDGSLVIDGLDLGGVGNINAGIGTFSGNLNVGGVLTYEDVKNVDSVGVITARTGIRVTGGNVGIGTANPLFPLHISSAMSSSPSFIHVGVKGTNTVGGGGGIAFDTSASESNTTQYIATIAGIRNSLGNGSNDLVFSTTQATENGNSPSEKLRITSSGKVGIGTDDPDEVLSLFGSANNVRLRIDSQNLKRNNYIGVSGADNLEIAADEDNAGGSSSIRFRIDADEKVRIDSSGRLLIGTVTSRNTRIGNNSFSGLVQIESDSELGYTLSRFVDTSGPPRFVIQKARGTAASPAIVQDDDTAGQFLFSAYDGSNFSNLAKINVNVDGTPGTDDMPGRMVFGITAAGSNVTTERLRINSTGQLELRKNQDGVTGRPENRIVFRDLDSSVNANQPIGEISWYSSDAGMTNVNSWIRGINEHTNGNGALLFGVKAAGSSEIEAMRIASDGKVGIGTDQLDGNLTIHADAANQTAFAVHADMGTNNNRTFNIKTPATDSGSDPFVMQTANALTVQIDTTERFRISDDGKVGISSAIPAAPLDVFKVNGTIAVFGDRRTSTFESISIKNNVSGYPSVCNDSSVDTLDLKSLGSVQATIDSNNNSTGKYFRVMTNGEGGAGTELFRVDDEGNVGIGTDNPSAELSIWSNSPNIKLQDTSPYVVNQYGNISQSAGVLQLTGRGDGATHGSVYLYTQNNSETLNAYRVTDSYHLWYTANDSNIVKMRLHNTGELQLDPNNTGPKLSNDNQALKIDTGNGYVSVGPQNTSYSHFYTDRARYYFNKKIIVDEGIISSYSNHDLVLTTGSNPGDNTTGLCVKNTSNYVGVGTNVPSTVLHIVDTERAQGADYATLSMGSPSQPLRRVEIGARRSTRGGDWDHVGIGFKVHDSTNHNDAPEIKMVLDYDGYLGVGTSNPDALLHVSKSISTAYDPTADSAQRDGTATINVQNDNGTNGSFAQIAFDTAGSNQSIARIVALRTGSASNDLAFVTESGNTKSEKFRIKSGGDVGIGTDNPTRGPLHINEQSTSDVQIHLTNNETGTTSTDGFTIFGGAGTNGRDMGLVNREEGGAIEFYTNQGGTVAQRMALWTDNHITTLAINTPSDGIHSNLMVSNHDTTDYNGVVNRSEYPIYGDIHFTGDATGDDVPTGNRSKAGLRLDQEYTITNAHSNTSGERVQVYGIHSTMNATKYAYALNGAYLFAATTANDLPRTGTVIGVYGYAQGYIDSASSTTKACNVYGGHFLAYRGGYTSGGHVYGVYGRAQQTTNGDGTKTGDMTGILGEVEVDEGTVGNGYCVRAVVDIDDNTGNGHSASTLTTGYLFHGSYSIAGGTTVTNKRGIWLNGCTDSYIAGDLEITGTFEKGTDNFRIPHPLVGLSTTKDLVHSVIEGPQMDLIYRGKVDLVGGTATINIDTKAGMTEGTFVSLCRDIQCFTSNETGWTAVKGSVTGNKITIIAQDNSCTDTISWMVVGERQDDNAKSATCTDNDGNLIVEPDRKPVVEFEKPECEDNINNADPNYNPADDGKD